MTGLLYIAQPLTGADAAAALTLAGRVAAGGGGVTVGWGGWPVPTAPAGVVVVPLPPAGAVEPGSRWIRHPDGSRVDHAWKKRRAAAVLALAARLQPSALLVEGDAAATGAFRFELRPLLEIAGRRTPRPLLAAWMRQGGVWPAGHPSPDRLLSDPDPAGAAAVVLRWLGGG